MNGWMEKVMSDINRKEKHLKNDILLNAKHNMKDVSATCFVTGGKTNKQI